MIRVTAEDLETGEGSSIDIEPGNYNIVCAAPAYLAHVQSYANGTTVLTIKGRSADLMEYQEIARTQGGAS